MSDGGFAGEFNFDGLRVYQSVLRRPGHHPRDAARFHPVWRGFLGIDPRATRPWTGPHAHRESVMVGEMDRALALEKPPPCLECGTCCFSNLETSVRVTGDDYERLGAPVEDLVHFIGHRAYMRLADGHCVALRVEPEGRFVCSVYDTRPDACRDLERESPQCQGELFTKKGRAAARLVELRRRARAQGS